jgi:hypothetical protein
MQSEISNDVSYGRFDYWLMASLAAVVLLAICATWNPALVDHDCAMYLQTGQLLLEGQVPYVDFVDLNPPLIMYLNTIPVAIAGLLGLPPATVFHLLCCLLIVISLLEIRTLLRQQKLYAPWEVGWILGAWVMASVVVYFHRLFGQREYLFTLLYVPFLLLRVGRYHGVEPSSRLACLIGVQAGIGCCIKPHFLVIACVVEAALLLKNRAVKELFRIEAAMLWLVVAAYCVHWLFVPQAMFDSFFQRWVPLVSDSYDDVYGIGLKSTIGSLLRGRWSLLYLGIVGFSFLLGVLGKDRRREFLYAISMFCIGAIAMYVAQRKGWEYQRMPLKMGAVVAVALIAMELRRLLIERGRWNTALDKPAFAGAGLLFVPFLGLTLWVMAGQARRDEPWANAALATVVAKHTQPKDDVLMVATSIKVYPVLLTLDRRPGSRYLWSFPIPLFYSDVPRTLKTRPFPYRGAGEYSPQEELFLAETREDIATRRPKLILIQNIDGPGGCPPTFNVHDYLKEAGIVSQILTEYENLPESETPRWFVAYKRKS